MSTHYEDNDYVLFWYPSDPLAWYAGYVVFMDEGQGFYIATEDMIYLPEIAPSWTQKIDVKDVKFLKISEKEYFSHRLRGKVKVGEWSPIEMIDSEGPRVGLAQISSPNKMTLLLALSPKDPKAKGYRIQRNVRDIRGMYIKSISKAEYMLYQLKGYHMPDNDQDIR